tara:strand:- start:243 stop:842 length:600 start_codon:yes stop_codon:yes gene_type:complete
MNDLIQAIKILSASDLKKINKYVDTLVFDDNTVFSDAEKDKGSRVDTSIRSSTGVSLNDNHEITEIIHNAMNKGLNEYKRRVQKIHTNFSYYPVPGGYGSKSWREGIQILDYKKGQEYKFHHDAATHENQREYHRKISIILYLQEATKGGGTLFPHLGIKPKPGYALIFPSNWCYPHAGEPVYAGKKRVAVTWYYVEKD